EKHPRDRRQRGETEHRQRRSAPLPRAPRRVEGARPESRGRGVAGRQRPRPPRPHSDAQLREERAGARDRPHRLTKRRPAAKKNQPPLAAGITQNSARVASPAPSDNEFSLARTLRLCEPPP